VERRREMLAMQMLRRRDQHRVDALILEKIPVVKISLRIGRDFLRILEPLGIDIGEPDELGVRTSYRLAHDLHPPVARPDDPEPYPLVRPENIRRRRQCSRQASSDLADEIAS